MTVPAMASEEERLFSLDELPKRTDEAWRRQPARPQDPVDAAREFRGWTLNKLEVLELYLKMYRRVAGGGTYIDAFAGSGRVSIAGKVYEGSAALALRSGAFSSLHFIEKDESTAEQLREYVGEQFSHRQVSRCQHHQGDCNEIVPWLIGGGHIDVHKPCFAVLDQDSTQLSWTTVQALSRLKSFDADSRRCKVELWVLFNTHHAMQRIWPKDRTRHHENPFLRRSTT